MHLPFDLTHAKNAKWSFYMQYKVSRQYARGAATPIAEFMDVNEAKFYIAKKMEADSALNIKVSYQLLEFNDIIEKFDPNESGDSSSQGSQGKGSAATFSPTPLNMAPRPSGMPPKWTKDEDDDSKKK